MKTRFTSPGVLALALALAFAGDAGAVDDGEIVVRAGRVLTGHGQEFSPGRIVIANGRVRWIGKDRGGPLPSGSVINVPELTVAPGFVDLRSGAGMPARANEESREVDPAVSALDFLDPAGMGFRRAVQAGVTTIGVSPGGRAVIGGTVALLKTDGRHLNARLVARRAALSATLGYEPTLGNTTDRRNTPMTFYHRRPSNRMGLSAVMERAFLDVAEGVAEPGPGTDMLRAAMSGELPTWFRARKQSDILAALRLADKAGLQPVILDAVEGYRVAETLAAKDIPVVLGPFYQLTPVGPAGWEGDDPRHANAKLLHDAGVRVAIASGPESSPGSLRQGAILAARHGLPPAVALAAITSTPASIAGQPTLGRLAEGAAADFVVLDGHPLDLTARVLATVIEGRVVHADPALPKDTFDASEDQVLHVPSRMRPSGDVTHSTQEAAASPSFQVSP